MLQIAPLRELQHTFILLSQDLPKPSKGRPKITLTTRPRPVIGIDGVKALAMIKRRKKRCKYVHQLQRCIADNTHPKKLFRPLQKYLMQKIKEGHMTPGLMSAALVIMSDYVQAPACSVAYIPN